MAPLIVIVGADKGGVGKTTVSRALLDFFRERGVNCRAFDTEMPGGVLKRFHPAQAEVVDLDHSDGQIKVFDNLASSPVTLIDMRAGQLSKTIKDLGDMGFFEMAREGKIRIAVLHVIGSTVASFNEIKTTAAHLTTARHFIVKNHTNAAEFFSGIDAIAKDMLQGAAVLDIPKLDERATEFVEAASQSFIDFEADETKSLVMRRKVAHWRGLVNAQFDIAKLTAA
jgi:hypothetical protein